MKFWQKIFLGTLIIFTLAFNLGAYILTTYSYHFNLQREQESGIREQSIILSSVTERISSAKTLYMDTAHNQDRLSAILKPLTDYYQPQGVSLALFDEERAVFSALPAFDPMLLHLKDTGQKNVTDLRCDGRRYLLVASQLPDDPHLTLIYARDISRLDDFRHNISRVFMVLCSVVLVLIGLAVYLLLRRLTRPIAELNQMTAEIASGAYSKRVMLRRNDELGRLGDNFNRMADSVEKTMQDLTKAAADRQQFIDDFTHEMKTPLTAILGYTEYLQNAKSSEAERQTALGHLYDAALRLKSLSVKLLELASLRGETIELQPLNVSKLFCDLTNLTRPLLTARNLTLALENHLPTLRGDETLLLSLLTNLVENAARACKPGGIITVKAEQGETPRLEVSDSGHGIAPDELAKITAPFYRADKSRSRKFGGVGLGLSVVSQIAALHGARLEIDSTPGKGTTVRLYFTT